MSVEEIKGMLKEYDLSELKPIPHALMRARDKKRQISYPLIIKNLISPKALYKAEKSKKHPERYELYSKLTDRTDLMVVVEFKKDLNIITAYKTDKFIEEKRIKLVGKHG